MTIDALNSLGREDFVNAVGWVFEGSEWVAERAWNNRIFEDADSLHQAMVEQVEAASSEEQLALLRAHPNLGIRARITQASSAEQAGAGLDRWSNLRDHPARGNYFQERGHHSTGHRPSDSSPKES